MIADSFKWHSKFICLLDEQQSSCMREIFLLFYKFIYFLSFRLMVYNSNLYFPQFHFIFFPPSFHQVKLQRGNLNMRKRNSSSISNKKLHSSRPLHFQSHFSMLRLISRSEAFNCLLFHLRLSHLMNECSLWEVMWFVIREGRRSFPSFHFNALDIFVSHHFQF